MLTAHFTFSKTQHGCKLNNLESTLGVTRCAPPPPYTTTSSLQARTVLRLLDKVTVWEDPFVKQSCALFTHAYTGYYKGKLIVKKLILPKIISRESPESAALWGSR